MSKPVGWRPRRSKGNIRGAAIVKKTKATGTFDKQEEADAPQLRPAHKDGQPASWVDGSWAAPRKLTAKQVQNVQQLETQVDDCVSNRLLLEDHISGLQDRVSSEAGRASDISTIYAAALEEKVQLQAQLWVLKMLQDPAVVGALLKPKLRSASLNSSNTGSKVAPVLDLRKPKPATCKDTSVFTRAGGTWPPVSGSAANTLAAGSLGMPHNLAGAAAGGPDRTQMQLNNTPGLALPAPATTSVPCPAITAGVQEAVNMAAAVTFTSPSLFAGPSNQLHSSGLPSPSAAAAPWLADCAADAMVALSATPYATHGGRATATAMSAASMPAATYTHLQPALLPAAAASANHCFPGAAGFAAPTSAPPCLPTFTCPTSTAQGRPCQLPTGLASQPWYPGWSASSGSFESPTTGPATTLRAHSASLLNANHALQMQNFATSAAAALCLSTVTDVTTVAPSVFSWLPHDAAPVMGCPALMTLPQQAPTVVALGHPSLDCGQSGPVPAAHSMVPGQLGTGVAQQGVARGLQQPGASCGAVVNCGVPGPGLAGGLPGVYNPVSGTEAWLPGQVHSSQPSVEDKQSPWADLGPTPEDLDMLGIDLDVFLSEIFPVDQHHGRV